MSRLGERLDQGPLLIAEGYLFELERRGYLQAGAFVPEVVLEHPEKVTELHQEFAHAGTDVVEAFTYYAHREKLRIIGREADLERINRQALRLAAEVAREHGLLLAGNICNTNVWDPDDPQAPARVRAMFEEQVQWAMDAGVDFVIGETFGDGEEAVLATRVIVEAGLDAVTTLGIQQTGRTTEDWSVPEALRRLADAGARVVGLNCSRGPDQTLELLRELTPDDWSHLPAVAAVPVPYRTTSEQPTFQSLRNGEQLAFPTELDPHLLTRSEMAAFAGEASELGVAYLGGCCGTAPHHVRAMAEALGRKPEASRFSADMSKHAYLGTDPTLLERNLELGRTAL
jgi:betaine-homocysteine S-methyltransferase